jgi:hypothetical protein
MNWYQAKQRNPKLGPWGDADKDGVVVTRFEHGLKETSHPSYQAWTYAMLLKGFNEVVYEENEAFNLAAIGDELAHAEQFDDGDLGFFESESTRHSG